MSEQDKRCECGHRKKSHRSYSDHEECSGIANDEVCECDLFRPEPAPRPISTDLRKEAADTIQQLLLLDREAMTDGGAALNTRAESVLARLRAEPPAPPPLSEALAVEIAAFAHARGMDYAVNGDYAKKAEEDERVAAMARQKLVGSKGAPPDPGRAQGGPAKTGYPPDDSTSTPGRSGEELAPPPVSNRAPAAGERKPAVLSSVITREEAAGIVRDTPLAPDTHTGTRQRWVLDCASARVLGVEPPAWTGAQEPPPVITREEAALEARAAAHDWMAGLAGRDAGIIQDYVARRLREAK